MSCSEQDDVEDAASAAREREYKDLRNRFLIGLALAATARFGYIQWLERKLADARVKIETLTSGQPWLIGATTEYHLRKRIKALEAHVPKSVLRRLDAQINE